MTDAPDALPTTYADRLEAQLRGGGSVGNRQRDHQHAIAVRCGRKRAVDRIWQVQRSLIRSNGPLVEEQFSSFFDGGAWV
jgi:hypothetical protein